MPNLIDEIVSEIERVRRKLERAQERWSTGHWREPKIGFAPSIYLMTLALNNAKEAIVAADPVLCAAALSALKDFDDD